MSSRILSLTVADALNRWPEAAVLFQRANMACIGCAMAPFCTIADAIRTYRLDQDEFIAAFREISEESATTNGGQSR